MARVILSLLLTLSISALLPSLANSLRPFYRYRMKLERVGPSKEVSAADVKQAKTLGPNVCVKRVRVGIETRCILIDRKYNCSMESQYRSLFSCCPGYVTLFGKPGCPKELYTSDKNLIELAKSLKLDTLVSLIETAGLTDVLSKTKDKFTLFAPSEKAFSALDKSLVKALKADKKALSNLLLYHVMAGKMPTAGFEDNQLLETLHAKKTVRFNSYFRGQLMLINGARIARANLGASNGIIHVLDSVLMPSKLSAMEVLAKNEDTSLFRKALVMSGIKIPDGYTVLAPTNKAFNNMDSALFERLLKSPMCLKNLLLNHLLPDTVFSAVVADEGELFGVRTKEGTAYFMTRRNDTVMMDKASLLKKDVIALNAVVHVIDEVLIPTSALTVLEIAKQSGAVMFARLIKELGLHKLLSEDKKFTLFAPSDDALRTYLKNSSSTMLRNISDLIRYHIVPRSLQTCDFQNDMLLDTLAGKKKIRINVYNYGRIHSVQGVCLANKRCNIEACNGAVHILSRPLVAPKKNLKDIIESDSRFSAFSAALRKANLYSMLNQSRPLTIFAPTNAAFSKISPKNLENLLANGRELCDKLKYHIVSGSLFSCAVDGVCPVATMNGRNLMMERGKKGLLKLNQDTSSEPSLVGTNGILYPVDQVLKPRKRRMSFFQRYWRSLSPLLP